MTISFAFDGYDFFFIGEVDLENNLSPLLLGEVGIDDQLKRHRRLRVSVKVNESDTDRTINWSAYGDMHNEDARDYALLLRAAAHFLETWRSHA